MGWDSPRKSLLCETESIEGLTTNLHSLVFFARSMEHLRITLGFYFTEELPGMTMDLIVPHILMIGITFPSKSPVLDKFSLLACSRALLLYPTGFVSRPGI